MKSVLDSIWDNTLGLWESCTLYLHAVCYVIAAIFLGIGCVALFTGAPGLGIVLIVLNVLLLAFLIKLSKATSTRADAELNERIRRNLEDQKQASGGDQH